MSHQCPFPIRSTDSRCSYRTGSAPGFALCLALVATLSGYAGVSHAFPVTTDVCLATSLDSSARQATTPTATENRRVVL